MQFEPIELTGKGRRHASAHADISVPWSKIGQGYPSSVLTRRSDLPAIDGKPALSNAEVAAFSRRRVEAAIADLARIRDEAEASIDAMIAALDAVDDERECDDDQEPWLGWTESESRGHVAALGRDDREQDEDEEPSLGSTSSNVNQDRDWAVGERDEREQGDDDKEPSLGSIDKREDQSSWASVAVNDLEHDPAEDGVADADAEREFWDRFHAMAAFSREAGISNPAGQARALLDARGIERRRHWSEGFNTGGSLFLVGPPLP